MTTTGTTATRTHHSAVAPLGFLFSMGLPALVAIWGILALGWDAIDWVSAAVWGIVATIAFTLVMMMAKATGMTRMDLLDLLGSLVLRPGSRGARALGGVIHLTNGVLLAAGWAYGSRLLGVEPNLWTALAWGVLLWMLALLMMSTMGAVHPAIRRGQQEDPGPAATNFGRMTPVGSLMGHLLYGLVLGLLYANVPLG